MKELSIEQKAQRYDEAIEIAREINNEQQAQPFNVMTRVFPELKESKDEKTKKEIINYLECQRRDEPSRKDTHNKWISYIEKHALSKDDYDFLRDCARILKTFGWQSYADRLTGLCPALGEETKAMMSTPIFPKESDDERIRKALINKIKCLDEEESKDGYSFYAGDYTADDCIAWLEKQGKNNMGISETTKQKLEDNLNKALEKETPESWNKFLDEQKPMNEKSLYKAGYLDGFEDGVRDAIIKEDEQKVAWSEEDDKILKSIIINIENLQFSEDMREKYHHIPNANKSYYQIKIDWLKFIKERIVPQQKQEWSEEDKEVINLLLELVYEQDKMIPQIPSNEKRKRMLYWLKSLKERYTWKPSEKQMQALNAINVTGDISYTGQGQELISLYNDLKKLKGE